MVDFITIIIYLSIYVGLVSTSFYILSFLDYKKRKQKTFSEKDLPNISVLIPAYNEEKSIAKTIESILKVDYPKDRFEVIVIDDGSKDDTYKIAKKYENNLLRVFTKKNGGKGSALNLGISKAKGEIIFSMDADTFVEPQSVRNMVHYFTNPKVMAVTPTMLIHDAKTIWQRIQHMEYFLGVFLRKAFSTLNAVYVTPGAFSAYRKKFFDKHGGYDEHNITEDLEISLRIQYEGYSIENSADAPVYTIGPSTFKSLLIQRRRWYYGHIKNIWKYRGIISRKYGDVGMFIIPIGLLSIFFAIFIFLYTIFESASKILSDIILLRSFGFDVSSFLNINLYVLERFLFSLFSNQVFLFILLFMLIMAVYLYWAKRKVGKVPGLFFNLYLFTIFFAALFSFWWVVSIFYSIFSRDLKWR